MCCRINHTTVKFTKESAPSLNTDYHDNQLSVFAQFHKHCVVELTPQLFTFTKEYAPSISACFFTIKIVFQKDKHLIHFVTLLRFVWTHSWIRVLAGCGAILGTFSKPRRRQQRGRGKWAIVLSREFQDYTKNCLN